MKEKKDLIRYAAVWILILFLLIHYWDPAIGWIGILLTVIRPLLGGCAIAYVLNINMRFYERTLLNKWKGKLSGKRALSILMSLITFLLILVLIINMILPELKSCVEILFSSIPSVYSQIIQFLNDNPDILAFLPQLADFQFDFREIMDQLISWFSSGVGASVFNYITSVVSVFLNLFVALFFAIYLLAGKEWLACRIKRLLAAYLHKPKLQEKCFYVLRTLDNSFHRFIVGQCTEAVILGTLCCIGMLILRLPYAVMIGVTIGATALIPVFGAYIGGAVGVIMIFTVSPWKSLLFLIFLVILQQLENQLIYPRVVGTSIGLPGIFVFTAVLVGGSLFGVTGILLGIPLMATAYQLVKNDLRKREKALSD